MKTTPLPEILKQITPLPLKVAQGDNGGKTNKLLFSGSKVVADCENHMMEPATQAANAAYLTHAANVLPGLVEALRECHEMLCVAMGADENPFGIHHNQATDAISQAEVALSIATNVPVNS